MARHSHGSGPSQRQLRVGELIRRTLSDVLSRGDVHDPELDRIPITVGEVVLSGDLRTATAYVLPLGGDKAEEALSLLRRNRFELRRAVTRDLTLKFSPELRFELDGTFDKLDASRRMFADETVRRDVEGGDADGSDAAGDGTETGENEDDADKA